MASRQNLSGRGGKPYGVSRPTPRNINMKQRATPVKTEAVPSPSGPLRTSQAQETVGVPDLDTMQGADPRREFSRGRPEQTARRMGRHGEPMFSEDGAQVPGTAGTPARRPGRSLGGIAVQAVEERKGRKKNKNAKNLIREAVETARDRRREKRDARRQRRAVTASTSPLTDLHSRDREDF